MINLTEANLDLETTLSIVRGMKEMAGIDNEEHPAEKAIIDAFVAELQEESEGLCVVPEAVNQSLFNTPEKQMLFLQCITYVALADEQIQDEETELLNKYISAFSADVTAEDLIRGVGSAVLARYRGISVFTDETVALGATFGLSAEEVLAIIKE